MAFAERFVQNFTEKNTIPVFRTESQYVYLSLVIPLADQLSHRHRMLHSAINFAAGFFDLPLENQYQQSILIEANGVYPL